METKNSSSLYDLTKKFTDPGNDAEKMVFEASMAAEILGVLLEIQQQNDPRLRLVKEQKLGRSLVQQMERFLKTGTHREGDFPMGR